MKTTIPAAILTALVLAGCTAMHSQNPSASFGPVNAVAEGEDARLLLRGADVVAYFTQGQHVQGSPQFKSQFEGVTFRFASAANKARFDAEPRRYLPQYGGYCANGIVYAIPWGGDPDRFKIVAGKLYIFGGPGSLAAWNLDEPRNLALADKYWKEEVAGSNSFTQRMRRLVFRVPHYKTGADLARDVEAAKGKRS